MPLCAQIDPDALKRLEKTAPFDLLRMQGGTVVSVPVRQQDLRHIYRSEDAAWHLVPVAVTSAGTFHACSGCARHIKAKQWCEGAPKVGESLRPKRV